MSVHWGFQGPGHVSRGGAFQPGASVALDFVLQEYRVGTGGWYVKDPTLLTGWSFTRASTKNALDSAGVIHSFASGVPAITDLGVLVEESRTNLFLNSFAPATQTITLSATGSYTITVWGTGSVTVAAGTATISNAGAASSGSPRTISCTATGTITATVSGSPTAVNVEAGAYGTSPITTTGTTATRAADNLQIANATVSAANVTILGRLYRPVVTGAAAQIMSQGPNMPALYYGSTNQLIGTIPTLADLFGVGSLGAGLTKFGAAFSNGRSIGAVGGVLSSASSTTWSQGTGTTLYVGQNSSTTGQVNGYIQQLILIAGTYTDAQLQARTQ